jgi:hypothetical protein
MLWLPERIQEQQTAFAERVTSAEVRRRSWRVQVLQNRINAMQALSESRAVIYADEMDGTRIPGPHAIPLAASRVGTGAPRACSATRRRKSSDGAGAKR